MTSIFAFPGGAANLIKQVITGTSATIITLGTGAQANQGQYNIAWFRINEYGGATPTITVEVYDTNSSTSYYLGSGGFTWKAKAMTALQSLFFDDGYAIPQGSVLRVTSSAGSTIQVTGVYIGKQQAAQWAPKTG